MIAGPSEPVVVVLRPTVSEGGAPLICTVAASEGRLFIPPSTLRPLWNPGSVQFRWTLSVESVARNTVSAGTDLVDLEAVRSIAQWNLQIE